VTNALFRLAFTWHKEQRCPSIELDYDTDNDNDVTMIKSILRSILPILLLDILSTSPVVQGFTTAVWHSRNIGPKISSLLFLHEQEEDGRSSATSSSSSASSCYINNIDDDDDFTSWRQLRFHMINLIQSNEEDGTKQQQHNQKLEFLTSIVRACSFVQNEGSEVEREEEGDGDGDSITLPEHLTPLRRFLCTSSHSKDHQGCFRIFQKEQADDDDASSSSSAAASSSSSLTSLPSNVLFSQERPLLFLRDSLSYQSDASIQKRGGMMYDSSEAVVWCTSGVTNHHHHHHHHRHGCDELEFASRVLDDMPFAQLQLGSRSSALVGNSMADNCGNEYYEDNNKYLVVELDLKTVRGLESMGVLLCNGDENEDGCGNNTSIAGGDTICCKINADDLTIIETILGCSSNNNNKAQQKDFQSTLRKQQQSTILKMIDVAVEHVRRDPLNESNEPHLVLLSHSISASTIAAAISTWKHTEQQKIKRTSSSKQHHQRVEDLLHQALTVVTFGNVCRSFDDGPAYVHISMYDDPWTNALGSISGKRGKEEEEDGGGRDAVYFHACSPYDYDHLKWEENVERSEPSPKTTTAPISSLKSHNAHNLNACTIQYLCLIMRINGIRSFRALYDAARFVDPITVLDINPKHFAVSCNHGDLVVPPHIDDELLPAMIRATGGDGWIWKVDNDCGVGDGDGGGDNDHCDDDEVESLLPDEIETRSHLEESFGYNALEDIYATCRR